MRSYLPANSFRIFFPKRIMGTNSIEIARLTNPQTRNMLPTPRFFIHGSIAKGMAMLIALRRNAMPVKASPVI
jgi:hypothetical protein